MSERITAAEATEILRDLARGREDGNGADVWPLYDRAEDAMATVVTLTDDAAAHRTRADSAERDADALRRELAGERARAEAEEAARAAAQHTADTLGVRLTAAEAAREAFEASVYAELRAAEGECARLRSLLDVTARELVAAKAMLDRIPRMPSMADVMRGVDAKVAAVERDTRRTLCVDFDGVLHSYTSPWAGAEVIPDPPVPGAFAFLAAAVLRFRVAVFSARSHQPGGIDAMRRWFAAHALPNYALDALEFPTEKPQAIVYLDDRGWRFDGTWPSLDELAAFQPWNRRKPAP